MTKRASKYAKHHKDGFTVEEDGHFTVNYIRDMDGFNSHGVKKFPAVARSQWVEIICRNGDREIGPAECFAWGIAPVHANDRMDYFLDRKPNGRQGPAFGLLDLEITHWREIPEQTQAQVDAYCDGVPVVA